MWVTTGRAVILDHDHLHAVVQREARHIVSKYGGGGAEQDSSGTDQSDHLVTFPVMQRTYGTHDAAQSPFPGM